MEFLFEFLFEVFFEIVGEALLELVFDLTRDMAWGRDDDAEIPPWGIGAAKLVILVLVMGGLGWWRGAVAAGRGQLGWGLVVVIGVGVACAVALAANGGTATPPPSSTARRLFVWWPPARLVWFATANGAFAIAYVLAFVLER